MPTKLEQALDLARRGFYLFRLDPVTNSPMGPWREESTRNPETIKGWFICAVTGWLQDVNFAIDCGKSGMTAVDVDVKGAKQGKQSYEKLADENGSWGDTLVVKTPSGGLHLIYRTEARYKNSVEKLAPGIDIRGSGGFIVAAGSTRGDKSYHIIRDVAPIAPPEWLAERLEAMGKAVDVSLRESGKVIVADEPDDLEWALEYLQNDADVPGEGGRNNTAYQVACVLKERGVGLANAYEMMDEHWNPRLDSPIDDEELKTTVASAYKSAQSATGSKSAHAEFEIPAEPIEKPVSSYAAVSAGGGDLLPRADSFPPRDWVLPEFGLAKNVVGLIAPPGVGKSTFSLALALSTVSGKDILGIPAKERCPVAIFNNEDTKEEQMRRLVAAAQHYNVTNDMLCYPDITEKGSMLYVNGRDTHMMKIAKRDNRGQLRPHKIEELIAWLKAREIRLLVVDPLSMTHDGNENDNGEMLMVTTLYAYVANQVNCCVVLVHHTRKLSDASSDGHSGNLDSARGASSFGGAVRAAYTLNVMGHKDAEKFQVPDERRTSYILLEQAKSNMSAPGLFRRYFERMGEIIGQTVENQDGESVGILRPANLTDQRRSRESTATRDLVRSIEATVVDTVLTVGELARIIIGSEGMYSGKKPRSLEMQIRRLFSEGVVTGDAGMIHLREIRGKNCLVYEATAPAVRTIDDLL